MFAKIVLAMLLTIFGALSLHAREKEKDERYQGLADNPINRAAGSVSDGLTKVENFFTNMFVESRKGMSAKELIKKGYAKKRNKQLIVTRNLKISFEKIPAITAKRCLGHLEIFSTEKEKRNADQSFHECKRLLTNDASLAEHKSWLEFDNAKNAWRVKIFIKHRDCEVSNCKNFDEDITSQPSVQTIECWEPDESAFEGLEDEGWRLYKRHYIDGEKERLIEEGLEVTRDHWQEELIFTKK